MVDGAFPSGGAASYLVNVTASGDRLLERARIVREIQLTETGLTNSVAAPSGEGTIPSGAARLVSGSLLEAVRRTAEDLAEDNWLRIWGDPPAVLELPRTGGILRSTRAVPRCTICG